MRVMLRAGAPARYDLSPSAPSPQAADRHFSRSNKLAAVDLAFEKNLAARAAYSG
jgi:hypothetical protein